MDVRATTDAPAATGADTIAVGVFDGEGVAHDLPEGQLGALLESGEARTGVPEARPHPRRRPPLDRGGAGRREEFDPERARIAAAGVLGRARELGTRSLCWELPHKLSDAHAAAFVDGTVMGGYDFTLFKSGADEDDDSGELDELIVSAHHDVSEPVARGFVVAESVNLARDLQNRARQRPHADRAGRARGPDRRPPRHADARGDGPHRDRGGRHGRLRRASRRAATRSRS